MLEPHASDGTPDEQLNNRKSLLLLVHLVCIEVRMSLEDKPFVQVGTVGPALFEHWIIGPNFPGHNSLPAHVKRSL